MSLVDRSRASITTPDGDVASVVGEPLTDAEAQLLGQYETWLRTEQLTRWPLLCVACDAEAEPFIEPTQIGIKCAHRLLYYRGAVPVREVPDPPAEDNVEALVLSVGGPKEVRLSSVDAWMLRQYKAFMQRRGLREGLGCQRCDDNGRAAGCKTIVTSGTITVACRCKTRVFVGMTL